MSVAAIFILLATGCAAGFTGGMLGLGGAFIMTPLQYFVYTEMGLSPDVAIKTAFGTSLLVVLTIAISAAWRHHREQAVDRADQQDHGGSGTERTTPPWGAVRRRGHGHQPSPKARLRTTRRNPNDRMSETPAMTIEVAAAEYRSPVTNASR